MTVYTEFRKRLGAVLAKPLPTEYTELYLESQQIPALVDEAEQHRAWAECYKQMAKDEKAARMAQRIWAQVDTEGRCKALDARSMKVAQHLKLMDGQAKH